MPRLAERAGVRMMRLFADQSFESLDEANAVIKRAEADGLFDKDAEAAAGRPLTALEQAQEPAYDAMEATGRLKLKLAPSRVRRVARLCRCVRDSRPSQRLRLADRDTPTAGPASRSSFPCRYHVSLREILPTGAGFPVASAIGYRCDVVEPLSFEPMSEREYWHSLCV